MRAYALRAKNSGDKILATNGNGRWFVGSGPQLLRFNGDWEIVEDYGEFVLRAQWKRILKKFYENHPPEPYPLEKLDTTYFNGWMAPNGLFYRVVFEGHETTAQRLIGLNESYRDIRCKHRRNPMCGHCAREFLIGVGYIYINNGHFYVETPTPAQEKSLRQILRLYKK